MGKGRGSKALLACLRGGCLMHDASYWCPVLLTGREASLWACLARIRQVQNPRPQLEPSFMCSAVGIGPEGRR